MRQIINLKGGKYLLPLLLICSGCVHVDVTGYVVNLEKMTIRIEPPQSTGKPATDVSIDPTLLSVLADASLNFTDEQKVKILAAFQADLKLLDKKTCLSADDIAAVQHVLNNCK